MAVDYHAELELLSLANENNRTIYLVLRSEKEANMVYRFLSEYIDRDQIVGIYVADGEVAEESLINDIKYETAGYCAFIDGEHRAGGVA